MYDQTGWEREEGGRGGGRGGGEEEGGEGRRGGGEEGRRGWVDGVSTYPTHKLKRKSINSVFIISIQFCSVPPKNRILQKNS